jgi:hypothetical protein
VTEPEERLAPPVRGEVGSRDPSLGGGLSDPAGLTAVPGMEEAVEDRSLLEDLHALFEDGKTYASAELTFQKTRASFAIGKFKSVAIFGAGAALVALLAAIGLTVGMILSLATLIGPLAATLVVVGVLLIVAFLCARVAGRKWGELMGAFGSGAENRP